MYAWHLASAGVLLGGVALIVLAGNRRAVRRTAHELGRLDAQDREWLGAIGARLLSGAPEPPAARFNAGQKVNFLGISILLAALYVSGVDTIVVGTQNNLIFAFHKVATIAMSVLVAGHLYMALIKRATGPALRGILTGEVDRDWAQKHCPGWEP